jgi:sugar/nucleoside kinase (ribokinase family)
VGIGEARLIERGDTIAPGGLAPLIAVWANRFGHVGIPISRLGQDDRAEMLMQSLRDQGVDVSHLQSDPDLPTARLVIRAIGGRQTGPARAIGGKDGRAAFDNLQWDFDLLDVAQEADAVVFGTAAQRGGLSGSVIRRFLSECTGALRLFDLTNRNGDEFDRAWAMNAMELTDIVIVDPPAISMLLRTSPGSDEMLDELVARLRALTNVPIVVTVSEGSAPGLHVADGGAIATTTWGEDAHAAVLIAITHAQMRGDDVELTAKLIDRVVEHVREHPDEQIPDSVLQQ